MNAKERRGLKWIEVIAKAEFENNTKDLEWFKTQEAIQDDIQAYNNSIKPVEKVKKKEVK
jgi:hypothetical protein